jgi:hypothetical protein
MGAKRQPSVFCLLETWDPTHFANSFIQFDSVACAQTPNYFLSLPHTGKHSHVHSETHTGINVSEETMAVQSCSVTRLPLPM